MRHVILLSVLLSSWAFLVWKVYIHPAFFHKLRRIPGPKVRTSFIYLPANGPKLANSLKSQIPFIGWGLLPFIPPPSRKVYKWITTIPNHGFVRFRAFLGHHVLIPTSSRSISEVLISKSYEFQKTDEGRDVLRMVLGDGLIVSEGDTHRYQRKHLNLLFSFRHIKDLFPLMWSKSLEFTDLIKSKLYTTNSLQRTIELEVNIWASRATLDIIGVAALGRELDSLHNTQDDLVCHYEWLFNITRDKILWMLVSRCVPQAFLDWFPWKTSRYMRDTSLGLRRICKEFVAHKRTLTLTEGNEDVDTLARLIRSNNFSDDDLVNQLLTILAAGYGSVSNALHVYHQH